MKNCALKTAVVLSGMFASHAVAHAETSSSAADKGATFWIDHNILTWTSETAKPEGGNDVESSSLKTTPDDVTIGIFWKNYGLYVAPNSAGGAVGLSLYPQPEIEVGVLLGINNSKSKPDTGAETESNANTLGLFGTYYQALNSTSTLEYSATFALGSSDSESETAGVVTKTETKSNTFVIYAAYAYEVAKHFHMVPGIGFRSGSAKTESGGVSSTDKNSGLTLNIAHFRYIF